ncbi:MAG: hypothetical protein R2851_27815 [Caldilineaceae bacterium]
MLASVRVVNESGWPSCPRAYAEGRRAYCGAWGYAPRTALVYASGNQDHATGELPADDDLVVYEVKWCRRWSWSPSPGWRQGRAFISCAEQHDSPRQPHPAAASPGRPSPPGLSPVPDDYADGEHWDDVAYLLPADAMRVRADLLYQTASKEYIDFLRTNGGEDGATLGTLWDDDKAHPSPWPPRLLINVAYLPLVY